MNNSPAGFNPDMRVSPKIVIATLIVLSWVLILLSQFLFDPFKTESLAILTTLLSIAAWFLERRNTRLGRWFVVATLTILVLLIHYWLRLPNAPGGYVPRRIPVQN